MIFMIHQKPRYFAILPSYFLKGKNIITKQEVNTVNYLVETIRYVYDICNFSIGKLN